MRERLFDIGIALCILAFLMPFIFLVAGLPFAAPFTTICVGLIVAGVISGLVGMALE